MYITWLKLKSFDRKNVFLYTIRVCWTSQKAYWLLLLVFRLLVLHFNFSFSHLSHISIEETNSWFLLMCMLIILLTVNHISFSQLTASKNVLPKYHWLHLSLFNLRIKANPKFLLIFLISFSIKLVNLLLSAMLFLSLHYSLETEDLILCWKFPVQFSTPVAWRL